MTMDELVEKRAALWESMKEFLETHTDADGKLSAEDAQIYEQMEQEFDELTKSIERYENNAKLGEQIKAPAARAKAKIPREILSKPGQFGSSFEVGRASDAYKSAMLTALRTKFRQVSNLLEEGNSANGGFLVPSEWDSRLIDVLDEENVLRKLGTVITTASEHKINVAATKPAAAWISEGQPLTFGNATFAQMTLDAYKLGVGVQITNELLQDNVFDLETYIIEQFGKAIGNAEEDAFINGTGTNQPTGILTSIAASPTRYVTTAGASISADDVINLVYSLKRPYRKNAAFLINDSTLATLRKFKDSTQNYLWSPSYQEGEPDRLLGYPIYSSPYMPIATTSGNFPIIFGDLSYYNVADRGSRTVKELYELYAVQDISAFMMIERVDGILVQPESIRALQIK